ncbi:MAG: hypothetical protein A2268_07875 [Candidatus Raymondbacteria bacterium RifOxyA12_full_50_37]|uniref:Transglutaminase-like domain-containing protein n=1 Tax=Candidatus Raymondbacteria bacterium RIFOXYD12_FULL_49_13 TaxID=1817890 RepID=A0A1F7F7W1_UNCRA|nr:MAG: hypothetical protein A2268_07875 [Candidatus Raymondbacteria bacterium RifOxyA12_full_50_37]OGJ89624.1 MAG: hypothetical protein A2248_09595 [Candidatus Raymondbacteria bacterium RIFOXYA2_FULL_49_16]OGJ92963.1 MAG: hypothetical protein A2487_10235 [Candidatus Raymondbacteria bacterium RifOxyC12_full_50_8]OGK01837.1 MAG: hypothetical protein A2350_03840 [Candidatus Raymondbacteria bacterium RifOxyB12_full_50_8]OGK02642.1 MAG: hypothetical protein A2519_11315 [Candidatus Raymondbacteria b
MKHLVLSVWVICIIAGIADARLRNPWVVVDKQLNLWSPEKMAATNISYPSFPRFNPADPDSFFKQLIGHMMVWEHRDGSAGNFFVDFNKKREYCIKNGYSHHDINYYREHGTQCMDWTKWVNTLGDGYCNIMAGCLISMATQLGIEARSFNILDGGHAITDMYYNNGWHFFDLDEGGFGWNTAGTTYGLDWIMQNVDTYFTLPYTQTSFMTVKYFWSYAGAKAWIQNAMKSPDYMWFGYAPMGADMSMCLRIGEKLERFWNPINQAWSFGNIPVFNNLKAFGNGRITYEPNLGSAYADFLDGVYEMSNVQQVANGVQATGTGAYATWAVRSGNPIVFSKVTTTGSGLTRKYSPDMGITWYAYADSADVQELYDYLLKVEIANGSTLTGLKIETVTLLHPGALPRLREGTNACQLQMYDNDETLTMHPNWSTATNFNKYVVAQSGFSYGSAQTPGDYAYFPNYGQSSTGGPGSYLTLKLPGPQGGQVVGAAGYAFFYRNDLHQTFLTTRANWTETNSAQIRLSNAMNSGFVSVGHNTLHQNSSQTTMGLMKPSQWGFSMPWTSVGVPRKKISNPGQDGYFQFYYNGPNASTYCHGISAYAQYYINNLSKDYLNDMTITHIWNKTDSSQGSATVNITAAQIAAALSSNNGIVQYSVDIPAGTTLLHDPNNCIIMEVPGSVLLTDIASNPEYGTVAVESAIDAQSTALALEISPVPANPDVNITFFVPASIHGPASLAIYDLKGGLVHSMDITSEKGREVRVVWNSGKDGARALPSGVFVARLIAGNRSITKKIFLVK